MIKTGTHISSIANTLTRRRVKMMCEYVWSQIKTHTFVDQITDVSVVFQEEEMVKYRNLFNTVKVDSINYNGVIRDKL